MSSITHTYTTSSPKGDGCGHEHRSIEEAGACLGRFVLEGGKGRQVLRRSAADRRRGAAVVGHPQGARMVRRRPRRARRCVADKGGVGTGALGCAHEREGTAGSTQVAGR